MKKIWIVLIFLSASSIAKEINISGVSLNIDEKFIFQETQMGGYIELGEESLRVTVIKKDTPSDKVSILSQIDKHFHIELGGYWGFQASKIDEINSKYNHTWMLYSGRYIVIASLQGSKTLSQNRLNTVQAYLSTITIPAS